MIPQPFIKGKRHLMSGTVDDHYLFDLSGVPIYRQEHVRESLLPMEAMYNQFTENMKDKEIQQNQKHEKEVVIITPNKKLVKDYAEIFIKHSNKRISIPLHQLKKNMGARLKWKATVKKIITMLKLRNRTLRSYSPPLVDEMPGYYEARAERKTSVRKLKSRYSKFTVNG